MDPSTGHSSESLFLSEKRAYEARGKVVVSILERPLVAGGLQKPKEFFRDAEISKPASTFPVFSTENKTGNVAGWVCWRCKGRSGAFCSSWYFVR